MHIHFIKYFIHSISPTKLCFIVRFHSLSRVKVCDFQHSTGSHYMRCFVLFSSLISSIFIIVTLSSNCGRCVSAGLHCYDSVTNPISPHLHIFLIVRENYLGDSYSILPSIKYNLDPAFLVSRSDSSFTYSKYHLEIFLLIEFYIYSNRRNYPNCSIN